MVPEDVIKVELKKGRMEAAIVIQPGMDFGKLNQEICERIIKNAGVVINTEVREAVLEVVHTYSPNSEGTYRRVIAKGIPPVQGRDGDIIWNEKFDPTDKGAIKQVDRDKSVDYYESHNYITVVKGDHIATLLPPTEGTEGIGVDGCMIAPNPGSPCHLLVDDTVMVTTEGKVEALSSGLLNYDGSVLKITDQFNIPGAVDFSTGNIDFEGSVCVTDGVRDCFTVKCSKDLKINGLIEAAAIIAGGNAHLKRGMSGRDKGTIEIGDSLHSRYLNDVTGKIGRDMVIEREIVNSQLIIGRSLIIERGSLIGGTTAVGRSVILGSVGSQGGVQTILCIGIIPDLSKAIVDIDIIREAATKRLEKLNSERNMLSGARLTSFQKEQLTEIYVESADLESHIQLINAKKAEIESALIQYTDVNLEVQKNIFSGVTLVLRNYRAVIKTDITGPLRIHLDDHGAPVLTDLKNHSTCSLSKIATVDKLNSIDAYYPKEIYSATDQDAKNEAA